MSNKSAFITGIGPGFGEVLATGLARNGYAVAGLSRSADHADQIARSVAQVGGTYLHLTGDVADETAMRLAVEQAQQALGPLDLAVHNAHRFHVGAFADTSADDFNACWQIICLGAVNLAQAVLPGMERQGQGTLIFSGATASIKGGARFGAFASAKFALRGLAQSLAREYGPKGVHVVHAILDGIIHAPHAHLGEVPDRDDALIAEDIAQTYLHLAEQGRGGWSHEVDLRRAGESF